MKVKEALKIIREIDSQRRALDKIGEVLEVAEGIERDIKNLERQRERLKREVAEEAKREQKAAAALLDAQHANETQRMKTESDRLTQSIRTVRVEHEAKMAAFEREEEEAKKKADSFRAEIKRLTDRLREAV